MKPESFPQLGRLAPPDWPRLMGDDLAAAYLGVGVTMLRDFGPQPKKWRGRTLWDRRDLDRFADALGGQTLEKADEQAHADDLERQWRAERAKRGK